MTARFIIYGLCDPLTNELRYIGKSSSGMRRPRRHLVIIKKPKTHKERWVNRLMNAGVQPEIAVLEELADISELDERERWWIAYWRYIGGRLTNATDGGDGWAIGDRNPMRNPIAHAKHRAAMKARTWSPEHKANQARASSIAKVRDLTGLRFGRLVVIEQAGRKWSKVLWRCACDCGEQTITMSRYLLHGDTKSCGCLVRSRATCRRGHAYPPDVSIESNGSRRCRVCAAENARERRRARHLDLSVYVDGARKPTMESLRERLVRR